MKRGLSFRMGAAALALGAAVAAQPASATQVLVNGSFEEGPPLNGSAYLRGVVPDGWSALAGYEVPDITGNDYTQGGPPWMVLLDAQDGTRFIDSNGASPSGGLYQDVTGLAAGTTATLSYYVGQWAQNSAGLLLVDLIDPATGFVLGGAGTNIAFNNAATESHWQDVSFSVIVPVSGSLRVRFIGDSGRVDRGGPGLDNMRLEATLAAVPEPAAWALMLAGFGLIGGSLRRLRMAPARA